MFAFSKKSSSSNSIFSKPKKVDSKRKNIRTKIAELEGIKSAMPDPYYVRDMDYNIVFWPQSIAKLTGYSEEEAKKLKCYEIFKAKVCPPHSQCPTQHCITVKQFLRDVAVDVYHKNGDTVHSLVSNSGIYDESGNPIGAVEVVKDNTLVQETMNSIGETIKKIDFVSDSLNAVMKKVLHSSQRVDENASESLSSIKKGVETGYSVSGKAGESSKYATSVQENMKNINESMKFSVDKVSALKSKLETITKFINVIQEISAKTNFLAINASIEAAHAGEVGRGFKVVADGVKELSKNSQESALSIKETIQEIKELIKEATTSMNVTEKDIESGTNTISELLVFVGEIAGSIKELMSMIQTIESTAGTTSEVIEEQNSSVTEVSNVGHELSEIAKKLTHEFDVVFKAIQHVDMG
ncbi:MAG: methyl-accepting chemotaxis protein [Azoarcus sp.]|jgi:PAS domain S-box-containing protein|nr:methyl-accepting chemotaxis protein [Azoarcus sp.]